jgi:hypothetical protein
MKCRWNLTMLNLCGIVMAILKMATARNFSMSGHHNLWDWLSRCFLPSFSSFGWGVSEEKIKMWKVNAKWWQKLTLSLARWANNISMLHSSASIWIMSIQFVTILMEFGEQIFF